MPKGGGSKTPQLDHFPLSTDMVEKQGGKKVSLENLRRCITTIKAACLRRCLDLLCILFATRHRSAYKHASE